jgi:hypothetical protein
MDIHLIRQNMNHTYTKIKKIMLLEIFKNYKER